MNMLAKLGVISLLGARVAAATGEATTLATDADASAATFRDALLCEGRKRLSEWYEGGQRATQTMYSNAAEGMELRFIQGTQKCGGLDCVVVVGNFTVSGIKPLHAYSAIVDINRQAEWYSQAKAGQELSVDEKQGVRGMKITFSASPLPDRLVYEWNTYWIAQGSTWEDASDLWFVASTESDGHLKSLDTAKVDGGFLGLAAPVTVDSCLSSYHIRYAPDGKTVHVTMTTHINAHVPFNIISPQQFTQLTWGKTLEFLKQYKQRALDLAKRDASKVWKPPQALFEASKRPPFAAGGSCKAIADQTPFHVVSFVDGNSPHSVFEPALHTSLNGVAVGLLLLAGFSFVVVRVRRRRDSSSGPYLRVNAAAV
eukprot:TRINITY_DN102118_c0_g1_i1.p1 TRINITY_DN102118_c0_g1~~TRINITY_DN102118_c0_g1_i1.p1  ORF type:complete len:370 (+),score=64.58 TRINITY_DN102118_c0_g1_i1:66-1175(+)